MKFSEVANSISKKQLNQYAREMFEVLRDAAINLSNSGRIKNGDDISAILDKVNPGQAPGWETDKWGNLIGTDTWVCYECEEDQEGKIHISKTTGRPCCSKCEKSLPKEESNVTNL